MEKRKHVVLDLSQKLEVINRLKNGEKVTSVASYYGIGRSTVKDIQKQADKIQNHVAKMDKIVERKTMKRARNERLDNAMFEWYIKKRNEGFPLTRSVMIEKAMELNRMLGGDVSFKGSFGWLDRFKYRHGIQKITGQGM